MEDSTEQKIAHLAMIQAVIGRMASNSFALKTLSVTLCAGVLALVGAIQKPSLIYVVAGMVAVTVFWVMDARYLHLEGLYRALYDAVRTDDSAVAPYDMNTELFVSSHPSLTRIVLSWSVNGVYLTLLAVLFVVGYGIWSAK